MLNKDFKDMLQCLLEENVEFLLIGAYALAAYGYPRATKDLDLWIHASKNNAGRIRKALTNFGAPVDRISEQDFVKEGTVLQIGVAPVRIDITTKIDGVNFEEAYPNRVEIAVEGLNVPVISRQDLIRNKKASARPQDLVDIQLLEEPLE
jgi:nucleotidyltransferase AbiEii toxin of type IV toxin-antitoxin system